MHSKKILSTVGSRTFISLFYDEDTIEMVPAKIDTGADSSSVWASSIVEDNGVLSFRLFDVVSKFYTGKTIATDKYTLTQVKSSFGTVEKRYKVKLPTLIEGRKVNVQYTLANRAENRYPILIGRKTLAGKFIVDVNIAPPKAADNQKVLVLNCKDSAAVKKFTRDLSENTNAISCDFMTYDDLVICADYHSGLSLIDFKNNKRLADYDLVYLKTHFARQEFAAAVAEALSSYNVSFIDEEIIQHCSNTKVTQYARLAKNGLPIPKTIMMNVSIARQLFEFIEKELELPFVLKDPAADKGESNFLIHNRDDFDQICRNISNNQKYFVAQKFIPNDSDLRVLVFNKEISMVIRRSRTSHDTHLNNTSTGGSADMLDPKKLSSSAKNIAIESAILLNRQVAGVDLMQDKNTKEWYILEVNNSPQLASGTFKQEKIKVFGEFLREYAKK